MPQINADTALPAENLQRMAATADEMRSFLFGMAAGYNLETAGAIEALEEFSCEISQLAQVIHLRDTCEEGPSSPEEEALDGVPTRGAALAKLLAEVFGADNVTVHEIKVG